MLKTYFISERFFTKEEITSFKEKHGYDIKDISYSSIEGEIDFSEPHEKEFLLKEGFPKISDRFFS